MLIVLFFRCYTFVFCTFYHVFGEIVVKACVCPCVGVVWCGELQASYLKIRSKKDEIDDMFLTALLFFVGLVLLYFGAEWLVAGSSSAAIRFGVPALIVGLTVVSFGTSAPELLVSLLAVYDGKDGVSIGNILGSNIANIALILGSSALIRPVEVSEQVLKKDYPIMLIATLVMVVLAYDGEVSRLDGAVMVGGMLTYIAYSIRRGLRSTREGADVELPEELEGLDDVQDRPLWKDMVKVVVGIAGLAGGAYFLVDSAIIIADKLGIPELVIGITVVAVGTSLPELATSLVAAYRGESDISVGNVVGSNIFNILLVLGAVSLIQPMKVGASTELMIDLAVMMGVCVVLLPVMKIGLKVGRLEGGLLVLGYVAYTIYLFVRTAG